jgi:hypothetical protein
MKRILGILFALMLLVSCNSQKVYSDFDISYSKSGGLAPIYENLLIKGNTAHYSFEGQGKKYRQDFDVSDQELQNLQIALFRNNFKRMPAPLCRPTGQTGPISPMPFRNLSIPT